jgi:hypothetical protein
LKIPALDFVSVVGYANFVSVVGYANLWNVVFSAAMVDALQ